MLFCVMIPVLPVFLDYPFVITPSVFSLVYSNLDTYLNMVKYDSYPWIEVYLISSYPIVSGSDSSHKWMQETICNNNFIKSKVLLPGIGDLCQFWPIDFVAPEFF